MSAPDRPLRVAIVGLGVAGGVLASGLAKRGDIDLVAVENVGPDDHAHAGNGLNVGPNALAALRAALPEMADAMEAVGLPWTRWQAALADGTELYQVPLDDVADRPGVRIRWSELYRVVRQPIRDRARFRTTVEDIAVDTGADGAIALTLVDLDSGATERIADIDLLIAVDGRYSAVRAALCGEPETRYLGVANFRTLLRDDGTSGVDDMAQWFNGPNRLLAFRLYDDTIYLSGNFPTDADGEIPEDWKSCDWLGRAFAPPGAPADPPCAWLIDAFVKGGEDALHWSRQQEIDMRLADDSGRVLFLGDAGHAIAPTLGQGATTAIEDAAAFLLALDAAGGLAPADVPAFTARFAAARAARLQFVREFSWAESDTLRRGADPAAWRDAKHGPEFRDRLRRLYCEVPVPGAEP